KRLEPQPAAEAVGEPAAATTTLPPRGAADRERATRDPRQPQAARDPGPAGTVLGQATPSGRPPIRRPLTRRGFRRPFSKPLAVVLTVVIVLCLIAAGGYLASRQLYFIGTNAQGVVTIYRGLPYDLPAGIHLYETFYVSGVPASVVPPDRRAALLDNRLRSESSAASVVRALEL